MDIKFSNKESDVSFSEALANSKAVQVWIVNRMIGYNTHSEKVTLEICIDNFTKGDLDSYDWAIYSQPMDNYGIVSPQADKRPIINGGLIYRGLDNDGDHSYSSHT